MAKSKRTVLLPGAKRDVKKAYQWYEEQKDGLGESFLERVEECLASIARSPTAFQLVTNGARRAIVKQFPYVVFYSVEAKAIRVYAVFHTSRNPQLWMDRLAE
jgi:toxin ParE1/3/4